MAPITDGTCKFVVTKSGGVLPGTVTAFSGTVKDGFPVDKNTGVVDKEWHLCDGTNGTPDLRNRFIYGGDGPNSGGNGRGNKRYTECKQHPQSWTPDCLEQKVVSKDGAAIYLVPGWWLGKRHKRYFFGQTSIRHLS